MKRSTLMKAALVATAMFMFTGAFAQTHNGKPITGHTQTTYTSTGPVYMVEGTTIPIYAQPDPVYHPDWDYSTANWTLRDGFTWNWSEGTTTLSFMNAQDNYVEIQAPANSAGTYTVEVYEKASGAFGGCQDATPTQLTVNVVKTPTAIISNATNNYCEGDATIPTSVDVTISDGWQNYRLVWNLEIATLDGNMAKDQYYDDEDGTNPSAAQKYAVNHTTATPEAVAAAGTHNIMTVGSFKVINSKPTVYTYNLVSINDQALRFGDFITLVGDASDPAAFTYNTITNGTYIIQINPAPVTGPIYHIPSTWAN